MSDISKGARFQYLTGFHVGAIGTVDRLCCETCGRWILDLGEGMTQVESPDDLAGARFQRLADAPPAPDPLFAEIEATIARLNILPGEGAENAIETVASIACEADSNAGIDVDADRKALLECAAFCLAGIRDIDRGAL